MMKTHELPPNAGRVINSLRDAGYDFNTAVADIVDNSIAAKASTVAITASCMPHNGQIDISITDNGTGMAIEEVFNAMTYGSEERTDLHSLGKFGLGLKTASTSQCRRVSLISRRSVNDQLFKLVLDIDHAKDANRWEYLEETVSSLDKRLFEKGTNNGTGTLVRWEKCDRVLPRKYKQPGGKLHQTAFKKKITGLKFHLAIVFQRFLDEEDDRAPNVQITLNGEVIKPWDPFCKQIDSTIQLPPKEIVADQDDWNKTVFTVAAFIVPTRDEMSSWDAEKVFPKGISPDKLQGIFVYRENRLIHWGDWCKLRKTEFHYRLCRIELSFSSELDKLFNVDFKKSQIQIDSALGEYLLSEIIEPARRKAEQRYRGNITRRVSREAEQLHSRANAAITKQSVAARSYEVKRTSDGRPRVTTIHGATFTESTPVLRDERGSSILPVKELPEGVLWQPRIVEDAASIMRASVEINTSHPFYAKAYSLCKNDPNAIRALDYLLWSLANAEYSSKDQRSIDNFEEMRREVSRNLRNLAKELPHVADN